eukprot:scaffold319069_cov27-Tisochrysis_lutea.AAC.2
MHGLALFGTSEQSMKPAQYGGQIHGFSVPRSAIRGADPRRVDQDQLALDAVDADDTPVEGHQLDGGSDAQCRVHISPSVHHFRPVLWLAMVESFDERAFPVTRRAEDSQPQRTRLCGRLCGGAHLHLPHDAGSLHQLGGVAMCLSRLGAVAVIGVLTERVRRGEGMRGVNLHNKRGEVA